MVVNSIILGRAKGSAGNVTTSTQKGRVILKQKATEIANPRTADQVAQRSKFGLAVIAWQFVGGFVKSGITQTPEYGNEYNAFVSANIKKVDGKDFDKDSFKMSDLAGLYATLGNTSGVSVSIDDSAVGTPSVIVDVASQVSGVKAGDKIVFFQGDTASQKATRAEYVITAADIIAGTFDVTFNLPAASGYADSVNSAWFESADGKRSTTSLFQ